MNRKVTYKAVTFGEWLQNWYNIYKAPTLRPNSVRNIEQMIRLHTPAWLKAMPLVKITPLDLDKALAETPKGRTRVYVRQVWGCAFGKAYRLGMIDKNIMEMTEPVKYKKTASKALTIKEQTAFLNSLHHQRMEWLMLFYLYTGVRRCEALAITWADIDEEEDLILIRGTKTEDSYRHILLTDDVKDILQNQRKQNEKEKQAGRLKADDERIFPYCMETVSRTFKRLCPNHHLHELRHTYITRCCESGVNMTVCQQLVGHSTADMTLNVYTHVMDEFKRKEAKKYTIYPDFGKK
jgi:integrase